MSFEFCQNDFFFIFFLVVNYKKNISNTNFHFFKFFLKISSPVGFFLLLLFFLFPSVPVWLKIRYLSESLMIWKCAVQCVDLPLGADLILGAELVLMCNMLILVQSLRSKVHIWTAVWRTFLLLVKRIFIVSMYCIQTSSPFSFLFGWILYYGSVVSLSVRIRGWEAEDAEAEVACVCELNK